MRWFLRVAGLLMPLSTMGPPLAQADEGASRWGVDVMVGAAFEQQQRFTGPDQDVEVWRAAATAVRVAVRPRLRLSSDLQPGVFLELPVEATLPPSEFPVTVMPRVEVDGHVGRAGYVYGHFGGGFALSKPIASSRVSAAYGARLGAGFRYVGAREVSLLLEANLEGYISTQGHPGWAVVTIAGFGTPF